MTDRVAIQGVGLWTQDYANLGAWRERREERSPPRARVVPALLRRRLSPLSAAMIDALTEALGDRTNTSGGAGAKPIDTIFGSAYGETGVLVELLDQLYKGGGPSPTGFASSVHNAASGYYSIATANRGFTTSIAAGHDTLAACLFEAFGRLGTGSSEALVVVGDLEAPSALVSAERRGPALAVALHLSVAADAQLGFLTLPRQAAMDPAEIPHSYTQNPCGAALALVDTIALGLTRPVRLDTLGSGFATRFEAP
ncbi:MAG TPA: beta-ketoacyl synthase chain length factor [Myxococcota bacterium]|nr:beta-ketoacyl synthase chain length factor [Myxococcota bacterium]